MKDKNGNGKKSIIFTLCASLGAMVIYGILGLTLGSPVHKGVDEQLYIALARSFHYDHCFMMGGEYLNYSSVLYSMVLSLAYYFYSPSHIIHVMRLINVLVSVSSVIPVWLLTGEAKLSESDRRFVVLITLITPEMTNCMFMMQEVLLYPVSLWTVLLIFKTLKFERPQEGRYAFLPCRWDLAAVILLALCYFSKTSALGFAAGYFIFLVFKVLRERHDRRLAVSGILRLTAQVLIYVIILMCGKYFVSACNGFAEGSNHYARQITWIFPIDVSLLLQILIGIAFYTVFLLFTMGPGMLSEMAVFVFKGSDEAEDRELKNYCTVLMCMLIMTALEVVVGILCTENRGELVPNKFIYRYLYFLYIPLLIAFCKKKEKADGPAHRYQAVTAVVACMGACLYFELSGVTASTAIMDADCVLLLQNISRYIFKYFAVAYCLAVIICWLTGYRQSTKKNIPFGRLYKITALIFCAGFLAVNCVQLPFYVNVAAEGKQIEKSAVDTVTYLDENFNAGERGLWVIDDSSDYRSMTATYFKCDYHLIQTEDMADLYSLEQQGLTGGDFILAGSDDTVDQTHLTPVCVPAGFISIYRYN